MVLPDDPPHPRFDLREVLGRQGSGQLEVVVETVLEAVVMRLPPELRFQNISPMACAITCAVEWRNP